LFVPSVSAQFVTRDISTPTAPEIRKLRAWTQHGHKEPELRMVPNRLIGFCIPCTRYLPNHLCTSFSISSELQCRHLGPHDKSGGWKYCLAVFQQKWHLPWVSRATGVTIHFAGMWSLVGFRAPQLYRGGQSFACHTLPGIRFHCRAMHLCCVPLYALSVVSFVCEQTYIFIYTMCSS
jgi:hypothetical protein